MLRAIFMIGLFAMLGLFAVGMVFNLFGPLVCWSAVVARQGVVFCTSSRARLKNSPSQQRHHDHMVACYFLCLVTELGGALYDVYAGAVVMRRVEIAGRKVGGFAAVQIAC